MAEFSAGMQRRLALASLLVCDAHLWIYDEQQLVWIIRLGATVTPGHSGALSVLAATAVGCLTLRLSEMNDSIPHLLLTHYTPSFLFALFGAFLGKHLFKW